MNRRSWLALAAWPALDAASPAALVDALGLIREERLAADKVATELKGRESALETWLVDNLPKSDATGISGRSWGERAMIRRRCWAGPVGKARGGLWWDRPITRARGLKG